MSNWKSIRLELGRTDEFPAGSVSRGFLIRIPLGDDDHVDAASVAEKPHRATVRRYWSTEPDEAGQILRLGDDWTMLCNGKATRIVEFDGHPMRVGQQISVTEPDGSILPFRIASIR